MPTETSPPLMVYNTLSKKKEPFEPIEPGKVGMYLCGPTVYKPSHIGHMVGPIIFDVIKRYLSYRGYQVTWVVNITDVDDKLIKESRERGITMQQVAEEMTQDYHNNLQAMGIDTIDHFPKATEHMDEIIRFTQELIDKDFAYAADNGDVYFDVSKDPEYGKLSGRDPEQMRGSGGETGAHKRSALDFALWKAAKAGEPSWESPWGHGRPGWHIECSAMSRKILGKTFDIHGGGLDLAFPHHENEIAQSECCHESPQAKYWMHNGLVQAMGEVGKVGGRNTREQQGGGELESQIAGKMGKSNEKPPEAFRDLLKVHQPETIRFFILSTHYRQPITMSTKLIQDADKALDGFYRLFQRFERITGESFYDLEPPSSPTAGEFDPAGDDFLQGIHELRADFLEAMDDDFNTGEGIGVLNKFLRQVNRHIDSEQLESAEASQAARDQLRTAMLALRELTVVLGLFRAPVAEEGGSDELVNELMELLISIRADLRKQKNFQLADQIRNRLTEIGITLEDGPQGTIWSRS